MPLAEVAQGGPHLERDLYRVISGLTTLQNLHLCTEVDLDACADFGPTRYADSPALLSTLTVLTHLTLERTPNYEHDGAMYQLYNHDDDADAYQQREDELEREHWSEAQEAHRTSLLSALRCMPQLQHLDCPTLWLRPCETAFLTALTNLTLGGLLPPAVLEPAASASLGGSPPAAAAGGSLPPQLQELSLQTATSPRLLAVLRPPASLTHLCVRCMCFGTSDVDADGRITAEAVDAVGPAVRMLLGHRGDRGNGRSSGSSSSNESICVRGGGSEGRLLPREGAQGGHSEWVQQLQGLDGAFGTVTLANLELSTAELRCLGQTLSNLKSERHCVCTILLSSLTLKPVASHHVSSAATYIQHCVQWCGF